MNEQKRLESAILTVLEVDGTDEELQKKTLFLYSSGNISKEIKDKVFGEENADE